MGNKRRFTLTKSEWKAFLALSDGGWLHHYDRSQGQAINAEKCGPDTRLFLQKRGRYYGFDWTTVEFRKELDERSFIAVPLSFEEKLDSIIKLHDETKRRRGHAISRRPS